MEGSSAPLFEHLLVLDDVPPRSGALNMAVDETLLASLAGTPLLRIYRWNRPTISFGFFESWQAVAKRYPGQDLVRRWTGGGAVEHGEDVTYSLLVPRSQPLTNLRAGESYRRIHLAVQAALRQAGYAEVALSELQESTHRAALRECFQLPVQYDLLHGGVKLGGAAQRRTRAGLLHQGSVRLSVRGLEARRFAGCLPSVLAETSTPWTLPPEALAAAQRLATERYASDHWLRQR